MERIKEKVKVSPKTYGRVLKLFKNNQRVVSVGCSNLGCLTQSFVLLGTLEIHKTVQCPACHLPSVSLKDAEEVLLEDIVKEKLKLQRVTMRDVELERNHVGGANIFGSVLLTVKGYWRPIKLACGGYGSARRYMRRLLNNWKDDGYLEEVLNQYGFTLGQKGGEDYERVHNKC